MGRRRYSTGMKTFLILSSSLLFLAGCNCGPMDGETPAAYQTPSNAAYTQQQLQEGEVSGEPTEPTFMLPDQ